MPPPDELAKVRQRLVDAGLREWLRLYAEGSAHSYEEVMGHLVDEMLLELADELRRLGIT